MRPRHKSRCCMAEASIAAAALVACTASSSLRFTRSSTAPYSVLRRGKIRRGKIRSIQIKNVLGSRVGGGGGLGSVESRGVDNTHLQCTAGGATPSSFVIPVGLSS